MRAWLTQDSIPSTRIEYVLTLPASENWKAQFLGAFLNLALEENWEQFGTLTPQQMADEWLELLLLFESEGVRLIPVGTIMAYAGSVAPSGFFLCDFSEFNRADFSELFSVIGTRYGVGNGTTTANLPDLRGRVVVGLNAADADFNSLGDFGGQKNVTLELTEIPSHTHTQNSHNHTQNSHNHTQDTHNHTQNSHNHTQDSHNHTQNSHTHDFNSNSGGALTVYAAAVTTVGQVQTSIIPGKVATNQAATATNQSTTPTNQTTVATNQSTTPTNVAATATNQNAGGGLSHNNLQPYWVMNYIIKY